MSRGGWVKLHRSLLESAAWAEGSPEQRCIIVALLLMANYEQKSWTFGGKPYVCLPGQLVTSLQSLAKAAGRGVSIRNVRTSLARLEAVQFLTSRSTNKNRLVTLVNWALYQGDMAEPTSKAAGNRQATDKQLTTIKNPRTKIRRREEKNTQMEVGGRGEDFERIWSRYPRREGEAAARKAWDQIQEPRPALEIVLAGLERWQRSAQWARGARFISRAARWLEARAWEDHPAQVGQDEAPGLPRATTIAQAALLERTTMASAAIAEREAQNGSGPGASRFQPSPLAALVPKQRPAIDVQPVVDDPERGTP